MAHSYVMSNSSELEAFRSFTRVYQDKNPVLLIDTYNTVEGARKALVVARELSAGGKRLLAVRIDSGDLGADAKAVRRIFDTGGYDGKKNIKSLFLPPGTWMNTKSKSLLNKTRLLTALG